MERDGEVGNLDVPALGVHGQRSGARPGLGVQLGVRLQLCVQGLCSIKNMLFYCTSVKKATRTFGAELDGFAVLARAIL